MIEGHCHCGAVHWRLDQRPADATACNCTVCHRYGALWAYGYEGESIHIGGNTEAYARGKAIAFHFCPRCGGVAFWRALQTDDRGRRRIAVNLRLADADAVASVPIDHFDGLDRFTDLPRDGRCVGDYWF